MAMDLEALRRDLNAAMGREADDAFLYSPKRGSVDCLDFVFRDWGVPRSCFNDKELVKAAVPCLREEIAEKRRILDVLERYAAGE